MTVNHDQRRRRVLQRIAIAGGLLTVLATGMVAALGGDGRAGAQFAIAMLALTAIVVALMGVWGGIVDQIRGRVISRRRVVIMFAALVASLVGVAMLMGLQLSLEAAR